ncbi:6-chlorohydroxyquinol-1,2-dioxygenase [Tabrizicola sp. TH137]|uniref:dioxygenase family protein n=1 Tax=Tabrizicola sp. TH137 TaxID=2067452 RepID=UPI000C7A6B13|nr:dioxygenase [Tabrizicola sp. TH137]PLL10608.1 6-chlorohydroxyquinol-1,2-dioxygenase [Tabrizicola sp. TH137]
MDGHHASSEGHRIAAALRQRLDAAAPGRLADAVRLITAHAFQIIATLRPSPEELDAVVQFLTEVGYATDARRQEWVLLADVFGLSDGVMNGDEGTPEGVTPSALAGPFYRADAPLLPLGADLCRNGEGDPLSVRGRVLSQAGEGLAGAVVEVWHANALGRYENQDPDNQPEHNLRGRFITDADGQFRFRTIRPAGYALPDDGPVGQLARRIGLSLDRPAHIHFAVTAPGHHRLVTAIFDGSDAAIDRDALFAVKPGLIGDFRPDGPGWALDVVLVLAGADGGSPQKPKTHDMEG